MRSTYGEIFNHDDEADGYDAQVRNESDPIRTGYDEVLDWVVTEARVISTSRVLELGSGTGNEEWPNQTQHFARRAQESMWAAG